MGANEGMTRLKRTILYTFDYDQIFNRSLGAPCLEQCSFSHDGSL